MFFKTTKFAALSLALLTGCVSASADDRASAIKTLIAKTQENAPYPAIAVSVRKGDEVIFSGASGIADLEQQTPANPDTVFAIGSLTKSFTAISVAKLAVEGKIDLDKPAGAYLSNYEGPAKDAPVWTLMNHSSGLVNYNALPGFPQGSRKSFTRREMRDMFETQDLMFQPGEAFSYSNSGIYLLGLIIESVTGETYEDYLKEEVLEPLDLKRTYYNHPETIIPGRAEGYALTQNGFENAPLLDPMVPFSAGALASSVEDIQKYLDQVHRKNAFGDAVRDTLYTQKTFNDGQVNQYALGALVMRQWEGRRKIGHAGDIDGFSGYMAYYPDNDVSIVVLANTRDVAPSAVGLEQKIARIVFDAPRPAPLDEPLTDAEIAQLVGDYAVGRMRIGIDLIGVVRQDDGLAVRFGGADAPGPAIPLVRMKEMTFHAAHDDEMLFSFDAIGDNGSALMTVDYLGGAFSFQKQ